MCESKVYLEKNADVLQEFMADVVKVRIGEDTITCMNIMGDWKEVKGRIKEINFIEHFLVIREE